MNMVPQPTLPLLPDDAVRFWRDVQRGHDDEISQDVGGREEDTVSCSTCHTMPDQSKDHGSHEGSHLRSPKILPSPPPPLTVTGSLVAMCTSNPFPPIKDFFFLFGYL